MNTQHEERPTLEQELSSVIKGEVRFTEGDRSLYSTDASNYRYLPVGVVIPKDKQDIIETVRICRNLNIPIVSRGGGTGLAGQTTNEAVVLDMTKYYHKVLEIDPTEKTVTVQPGIVLDKLNDEVAPFGLIVGPDPATHSHCTIGGMIGNNSCGVHAQWGGKMEENVLELEVLTYEGDIFTVGETSREELRDILSRHDRRAEIYREILKLKNEYASLIEKRYPHIPRRVSGYNLNELLTKNDFNLARALVGSESTLVTILEAKIKLLVKPKLRGLILLGYQTIEEAADDVAMLDELGPIGVEAVDDILERNIEEKHIHELGLRDFPSGVSWLILEFGAEDEKELHHLLEKKLKIIKKRTTLKDKNLKIVTDPYEQDLVWKVRESGLGATARTSSNQQTWPGWEDAAVPPNKLGPYIRDFKSLLKHYGYEGSLYGHFGQGCVHTSNNFDLYTHEGIEKYHRFIREAARLVVKYGGSLSGEHGDGQSRGELLEMMYGREIMEAMQRFKNIWDPLHKMNPGKVTYPNSATDHLRLGENYETHEVKTHFSYLEDNGSFAFATQRCVGVGNCRQLENETMCPSFKVTFEEKYTTRGRARLLFEMMRKDSGLKLWKDEAVKESLDLCLACKGCKSDCPVSVDMATYKAEFLSHYYEKRIRPMAAYSMGLIFFWNRFASKIPWLVNFLTHTKPFSTLIKFLGGMAPEREIPAYAKRTFRQEYQESDKKLGPNRKVLLWVDSFNNYFHPKVLHALATSLEHCGFEVALPKKNLCCGRPLYDYGMLDLAKKKLKDILENLHGEISAGVPLIFAEPSCMAVFKDELVSLFPDNYQAQRLSQQCFTLAQFLEHKGIELDFHHDPVRKFVFHGHCHHKSLSSQDADKNFLSHFGEAHILNSGCCGMAGSFGFEKGEKYEVSQKVYENDLAKKLEANAGSILIADGFSCREQVKQAQGSYPLHSAQVLARAIKERYH
jgi:FAD/FMN-containing dehydrogenase/Fe-S oxidoreductase